MIAAPQRSWPIRFMCFPLDLDFAATSPTHGRNENLIAGGVSRQCETKPVACALSLLCTPYPWCRAARVFPLGVRYGSLATLERGSRISQNGQGVPASGFVEWWPIERDWRTTHLGLTSLFRPTKKPCKWPSSLPRALPVGIGAIRRRNPSTALRYSAATGDATLGELAEWDPEVAEPFAPGDLISASGSSERRDFPSK